MNSNKADLFVWIMLHEGPEQAGYLLLFSSVLLKKVQSGKCHYLAFNSRNGEKCMFSH